MPGNYWYGCGSREGSGFVDRAAEISVMPNIPMGM